MRLSLEILEVRENPAGPVFDPPPPPPPPPPVVPIQPAPPVDTTPHW